MRRSISGWLLAVAVVIGGCIEAAPEAPDPNRSPSSESSSDSTLDDTYMLREFTWGPIDGASSHEIYVRQVGVEQPELYRNVGAAPAYSYPLPLLPGAYHWITRSRKDNQWSGWSEVRTFTSTFDGSTTPELNYTFIKTISEPVLLNYLSHAMYNLKPYAYATLMDYIDAVGLEKYLAETARAGVKFILGAGSTWRYDPLPKAYFDRLKTYVARIHSRAPTLLLNAFVAEFVDKEAVEDTPIPDRVFAEFGLQPEARNFDYEKMVGKAGWPYRNLWGENRSVPDITQLETQMYYYYLATGYIGAGFESIWLGQIYLTAEHDTKDYDHTHSLVQRIRAFAAKHARRQLALIVSHQLGDVEHEGQDIFDFNFMVDNMKVDAFGRMVTRLPDPKYFDCQSESACTWLRQHPLEYDKPLLIMFDNGVPKPWLNDADELSYFDMQKAGERRRYLHRAYFELPLQFSKARFAMPGVVLAPYVPKDGIYPCHCPDAEGENYAYCGTWDYEPSRCGDLETIETIFRQWDYLHNRPINQYTPRQTDTANPMFDWQPVYGAEKYEVYCHNNSTNTPAFHEGTATSSYQATQTLADGYHASIVRYFKNGFWSDWSEPVEFLIAR